jgi:tetratricopeptide (TPR) repeat protein
MRRSAVCCLLLLGLVAPRVACGVLSDARVAQVRAILESIYRLDHDRAEALCRRMIAEEPEDPAGYVFLARTYWSRELTRHHALSMERFAAPDFFQDSKDYKYRIPVDPAVRQKFDELTEKARVCARALKEKDASAGSLLLGLAHQNVSTFDASLTGSWWPAFRQGERAVVEHRRVLERHPDAREAMLSVGTYEYVAGSLPWFFKALGVVIGVRGGNRAKGKEMIERAAAPGALFAEDASVMLSLIATRERNYERAYGILTALGEKYPENFLFQLDRASLARRLRRPAEAVSILAECLKRIEEGFGSYRALRKGVVYNRIGLAYRAAGQARAAERWFRLTLEEENGEPLAVTIARLELGRTLDVLGRREEAVEQYRRVVKMENVAGSRQEAERHLRSAYRDVR